MYSKYIMSGCDKSRCLSITARVLSKLRKWKDIKSSTVNAIKVNYIKYFNNSIVKNSSNYLHSDI